MNEDRFREIVASVLAPMLGVPGKEIRLVKSAQREGTVALYRGPNALALKPSKDSPYRAVVRRGQWFTLDERRLAKAFVAEAQTLEGMTEEPFYLELVEALPRWVIAGYLGNKVLLSSVLDQLGRWASQTYEGRRITCAVGITDKPPTTDLASSKYWAESYAAVLSNGFDTLVEVSKDGTIEGLAQLPSPKVVTYAPFRLGPVALWTSEAGRVALALNQHGEILVFKDGILRFGKRSGRWSHYVHDQAVAAMAHSGSRKLRSAIYTSCLDASFARSGACIAVVQSGRSDQFKALISVDDRIYSEASYKARLFKMAVHAPFQELDRRLRQELLALDGAVVLDHVGRVLAVGAIAQVPGGSSGGGRLAAAKQLSRLGLGVKVSADGPIQIFSNGIEKLRVA